MTHGSAADRKNTKARPERSTRTSEAQTALRAEAPANHVEREEKSRPTVDFQATPLAEGGRMSLPYSNAPTEAGGRSLEFAAW